MYYLDLNLTGAAPVLLLHGLGASGASWGLQFEPLQAAGYRVIAPDLRGFGRSGYPGQQSVAEMAADTAALLNATGCGAVYAAGISMGGTVALQLALDYPHLVRKLALVNTFAHLTPASSSETVYFALRFALIHTLGLGTQGKAVARRVFPHAGQENLRQLLYEQITQANPSGYRATMRALARFDVRPRLAGIRMPTLVVTGERDTTVPPPRQRHLVEGIPGARQVVIPDGGHAVIADQPEAFNKVFLEFLREG